MKLQHLLFSFLFATPLIGIDTFSMFPPMGQVYHPVSTQSKEAQEAFDQGLLAIYAFNHDEAYRLFKQASEKDPDLAMAYWGMALALGENINRPMTPEHAKEAEELVQKALYLGKKASSNEYDYILALDKRYSSDPHADQAKLRKNYKEAMGKLVAKYPDDLDAATLYGESQMNLRPWKLWSYDGKPAEGTLSLVAQIESILKRDPLHIGANHYYIHVIEASKHPEKALMSAYRLDDLIPEWGHMVHMPSHIYLLVGDYQKAAEANRKAVEADEKYVRQEGLQGFYPLHYMSHNLFFLCRACMWQERYEEALATSRKLAEFLLPHISEMPELEYYLLAPFQVFLYFGKWKEILATTPPKEELRALNTYWHFAKGMAFAKLGETQKAHREKEIFLSQKDKIPPAEELGYNSANAVFDIAESVLGAALAESHGDRHLQIEILKNAIIKQDRLNYNEPPDWYHPLRQTLGVALLETQRFEEAEGVFRAALNQLPRNGRSLYGLLQALKGQNKFGYWVERQAKTALKEADQELDLSNF